MKKALAIVTYARFEYFEIVLPSILNQVIHGRRVSDVYDIYLFQDGLWGGESEINRVGHQRISNYLDSLPSSIRVFLQDSNLGVAFHFDFIERLLFLEHGYDFVVFAEDDLVLAPGYMQAVDLLADKFHDDPRVGMVSAHPDNPTMPLVQQIDDSQKYTTMGHNWGFGLSRVFWEKRQLLVDCYLDLIRDKPYRNRPHNEIYKWLDLIGFHGLASSQDYIKQCATVALGACRLSTVANFGLPIGRTGLHCRPEAFKKMGFDCTVVFNKTLDVMSDLDDDQYGVLYRKQGHQVGAKFVQSILDSDSSEAAAWQARLKAGELHPRKLLSEFFEKKDAIKTLKKWQSADIPTTPHMEAEGISLLQTCLLKTKVFLEYGAGGSTVLAAKMGVEVIHSIDSDGSFLEAVRQRVAEFGSTKNIFVHYVDIGPTKEWGQPIDFAAANRWPKYCVAAWDTLLSQNSQPDLILIDGRFRVACFLASLVLSKPGTVILFDDYFDRPHYHLVEKHLRPTTRAGRMAKFIVDLSFSRSQVLLDLVAHSTNPA